MAPLLYIAGPYSDHEDPLHGVEHNILIASGIALKAWERGWAVICPHKNTSGFHHRTDIPEQVWLCGDIAMLLKCDAILMIPGWMQSHGAVGEWKVAKDHGLKVFDYEITGIPAPAEVLR